MGSGGSKKGSLDANYNSNRRPSQHELTNPPTECRDLKNCKFCKRSFAEDRIEKHKEICSKTSKTRDTFDVKEQRLEGTEAEAYKDVKTKTKTIAKDKWKKTHNNMMSAIKEAKKNRPPTAQPPDVQIILK